MFRRPLLPCAYLIGALSLALSFAALTFAPAPALSQDRSTQERLDRLERDLNMLQRQVYRGLPPPAMAGDGNAAVNLEVRMERLEAQMRDLTGRVEEFSNQVAQLHQRLEQINSDMEMRFSQSSPGSGPQAAAGPPIGRPGASGFSPAGQPYLPGPPDELSPPEADGPASPMPPGGPAPIFGTLRPPGSPSPPAELASTGAATHPPGDVLPHGSATEQYNYAFGLLKKADYPGAEAALKAFLARYPKDRMAGNAQYWLGETYYTRGRYLEAASIFAEGYKRYPKNPKAADNLLKLGMALSRANQKQNACIALAQLAHDFPHAGASVKEHAKAEKKHLGC